MALIAALQASCTNAVKTSFHTFVYFVCTIFILPGQGQIRSLALATLGWQSQLSLTLSRPPRAHCRPKQARLVHQPNFRDVCVLDTHCDACSSESSSRRRQTWATKCRCTTAKRYVPTIWSGCSQTVAVWARCHPESVEVQSRVDRSLRWHPNSRGCDVLIHVLLLKSVCLFAAQALDHARGRGPSG